MFGNGLDVRVGGLRAWARGDYACEAAVELLVRGFGGRFASGSWPWVRVDDRSGSCWLDPDEIPAEAGVLSSGERAFLILVAALAGGPPAADLGGVLACLDREHLGLVLAAFAHAGGSHEHAVICWTDEGARFDRPGPLVDWPVMARSVGVA
ncbi:hypothetical protein FOE78_07865 [Microlunatus elymi]|uniref:Uncharacterized protein n=1 Tax=Microlunatus elymi TaxID=2596828 RepID=A0A516PXD1_9ACTN|nr:hypothetical protein [Microlunatus elymi]QDP95828.1 hypothetical protein FOE78_07865 [Microlunatus elymi]